MKRKNIYLTALMVLLTFMSGSLMAQTEKENKKETKEEIVDVDEREALKNDAQKALDNFKSKDAELQNHLDSAAGYAIFPNVGKGAWILGGAAGNGIVYENGQVVGYTELRQIDIGFQIGGQAFSELIIFKDQAALDNFKQGNFEFEGSASAVIWDKGKGKAIQFEDGVGVALMPKAGLMAGISVGGQEFDFRAVQE
ncbi:lipid-binding SYLF domain-containing protein [Salinimicrobium oceani]|uniref:Lipid-binding SYLF domain-containing protein n=1 Tax=Salinimicrobium oceani TaxID=2722702 RepID=A0ABX1CZ41_9FLAO|nr:lipid-binding SYLF domain-containing protein [Salinimicrobium oceani]NJW52123.1 lipid-binding SYLF domain-containing protein [Salinimicrobium oceani]